MAIRLLSAQTATGAGTSYRVQTLRIEQSNRTFQGVGTTTAGAGAATIAVQVSNDNTNWLTLGTINLTLSTTASTDGFASVAAWDYVRGNVTAISGTGASVTLLMGL